MISQDLELVVAEPIDPEMWETPQMRAALAKRDIATVYRLLRTGGVSQRRISKLTGQAQSEICEITSGRKVTRYDLLVRIADGFGVPRGYLGTAHDEADQHEDDAEEVDEDVKRRAFLAAASMALWGKPVLGEAMGLPDRAESTPLPERIGSADVDQLWTMQRELTQLGERYGALPNHQAMRALVQLARELQRCAMSDFTRSKLQAFLARVYGSLGWSATDCGLPSEARDHYQRSLAICNETRDQVQMARTLSFAGRSALQWTGPAEALRVFSFGSLAALNAKSHLFDATIAAHSAQAFALMGHEGQARDAISRSYDEYGDADPKTDGGLWYPLGDLTSAEAATRHALGEHDRAVECAESAVETREDRRVRSHAFRYSRLAMFNLAAGDRDTGVQAGREAVRCAGLVRSERVRARIKPVADWAAKYGRDEDARNLARDVRKLIRT